MKFAFIRAEKARHDVALLCRVLGVSRSGYYAWQQRGLSEHALRDAQLGAEVVLAHRESRGCRLPRYSPANPPRSVVTVPA